MKSMRSFVFLVTLVFTFLVGSAQAAVVLQDTFESHPLGALPSTPEIGTWWGLIAGTMNNTIQNTTVKNGTQALRAERLTSPILQASAIAGSGPEAGFDIVVTQSWLFDGVMPGMGANVHFGDYVNRGGWYTDGTKYYIQDTIAGGYMNTPTPHAIAVNRWDTLETRLHFVDAGGGQLTGTSELYLTAGDGPRTLIGNNVLKPFGWSTGDIARLWIGPSNGNSVSYWDDISIEKVIADVCGDVLHPYPVGDLTQDCLVNILDFAELAANWMVCTDLNCP